MPGWRRSKFTKYPRALRATKFTKYPRALRADPEIPESRPFHRRCTYSRHTPSLQVYTCASAHSLHVPSVPPCEHMPPPPHSLHVPSVPRAQEQFEHPLCLPMGRAVPTLRYLLTALLVHSGVVCRDPASNQTSYWSVELLQKETYSAVGRALVAADDRLGSNNALSARASGGVKCDPCMLSYWVQPLHCLWSKTVPDLETRDSSCRAAAIARWLLRRLRSLSPNPSVAEHYGG